MSNSSKTKKVAKKLLSLSIDEEGRVDEGKVRAILDSLRQDPPLNYRALLKEYQFETRRFLSTFQCSLELSDSDQSEVSSILSDKINSTEGGTFSVDSSQNPRLIAGFKLKIGDDVYEDSIDQRLVNLRKSLS